LKKRNVHIISLGCPKNLVDSEVMAALLAKSGYSITTQVDDANIILVNTCAFITPAKEESIDEILRAAEWKRSREGVRLVVTGCLPQRYGRDLEKELPEVDLFLGVGETGNIARHLDSLSLAERKKLKTISAKPSFLMNAKTPRLLSTPQHTAYLKIAEGCSNRCSYCIIPVIRGKARSRGMADIVAEARTLAEKGTRELIITAQDTTAYGRDMKGKPNLALLLEKLSAITGIHWIRLLYAHPAGLSHELLDTIATRDNICKYIDVPIQHVDTEILKSMNRLWSSGRYRKTIEKTRECIPGVALRTSIIVGFPGETRAKFARLISFIREMRFDHLGVFTYSREEGTRAASFPSRISEKEKDARMQFIMEEQAVISYQINQSLIGSIHEILIEGKNDSLAYPYVGRCERQAPEIDGITYVKGRNLAIGSFVRCKITASTEYDLYAKELS